MTVVPTYNEETHYSDRLLATIAGCDVIVSWNFRHIVHYDRIPLYNAINALAGRPAIAIHSPAEVVPYEEEEV
jgi:hypothetical protein